jgi:tetratricopeptide (TPR) repeat protein
MMRRMLFVFGLFALLSAVAAGSAQEQQPASPAQKDQPPQQQATPPSQPPQPDTPIYDPFHAQQDVEVGTYYEHKGDLDAAIGRYEDAIRMNSKFAKPRLLLAKIYEKKGDTATALKYYKEYLTVFPDAPDAKKIQKKIDSLSKK